MEPLPEKWQNYMENVGQLMSHIRTYNQQVYETKVDGDLIKIKVSTWYLVDFFYDPQRIAEPVLDGITHLLDDVEYVHFLFTHYHTHLVFICAYVHVLFILRYSVSNLYNTYFLESFWIRQVYGTYLGTYILCWLY